MDKSENERGRGRSDEEQEKEISPLFGIFPPVRLQIIAVKKLLENNVTVLY